MKTTISVIILPFCFLMIFSCGSKHIPLNFRKGTPFVLSGTIVNKDSGKVYLCQMAETKQDYFRQVDSAFIVQGAFTFSGRIQNEDLYKFKINTGEYGWPYSPWFVLDTGYTRAQLFRDSMANSKITGGKQQQQLTAYNGRMAEIDNYYSHLSDNTMPNDSQDIVQKNFMAARGKLILETVSNEPDDILSAFIAQKSITLGVPLYLMDSIYKRLAARNNFYAKSFKEEITKEKKSAATTFSVNGTRAPKFVLKDIEGNTIKRKSFKGKYLLLDFWASWCKPCLDEMPALISVYNSYHAKGFTIVGVSLDIYKENFEDALQRFHLPWPQTCDFKGNEGKLFKKYKVDFIPYNFLIDAKGRIINQNINPEKLNEILAKIYPGD